MLEPSPDRIAPRSPTTPARRGRCCPTSASSRSRPSRSRTRCGGSASSTASSSSRSCPRWSSGATATSSSTRSAPAPDGELVCGFHAPGRWDEIVPMTDCLLASERGNAAARAGARLVPRARASARGTGATSTASCATSSCARAGAPASSRSGSSPRPGKLDVDALIAAVDCDGLFWTQTAGARREHPGRRDRSCSPAAPQLREQLGELRVPDLARRVLPDQHRDGRAALRRRRRDGRRCAATSASSTSTAASARSG